MASATTPTEQATDAIRARLLAGEDVSAAELAAAEAADRSAEAERRRRIAEVRDALPSRFDPARMDRAAAKAAAALDAYLGECAAHDRAHDEAAAELRGLGPLPEGLTVDSPYFGTVVDGGRTYRRARPQATIHRLATEAIGRHYPRRQINLGNPQD